ncbi:hypothetical protein CLF_103029 [Clonorchis sinensis]|uniref:Uncharacterized protein n=1 Tax=Clonorchis sinensis TaxID=79923 RepID=G7Y8X8_CLOSI|nr:hypothetical protein CLF_103029 [Clonorchis sinensis]
MPPGIGDIAQYGIQKEAETASDFWKVQFPTNSKTPVGYEPKFPLPSRKNKCDCFILIAGAWNNIPSTVVHIASKAHRKRLNDKNKPGQESLGDVRDPVYQLEGCVFFGSTGVRGRTIYGISSDLSRTVNWISMWSCNDGLVSNQILLVARKRDNPVDGCLKISAVQGPYVRTISAHDAHL